MSSAAVSISNLIGECLPSGIHEFVGTGVLRSDHRLCRAPIGGAWVDSREVRSRHPLNIRVRCRCRCTPLPVGCTEKAGLHWLPFPMLALCPSNASHVLTKTDLREAQQCKNPRFRWCRVPVSLWPPGSSGGQFY